MKLSIKERVLLLNVLPSEGDLTTIKIVRELREGLSFSEEELEAGNIQTSDEGNISWGDNFEKDVEIVGEALKISQDALTRLDEEKKLNVGHISLYEKIVGDK